MEHLLETASEMRVLRKMANWHSCYKEISWSLQLFHRTDFVRKSVYFHELFRERQYYTYKKFFINYSKKKAKSLKYSTKRILLLIKLQLKGLQLWLEINSFADILKYFGKVFCVCYYSFNLHIHRMGPWGPKQYIFGDHFKSKNARKLRFHELLHFYAGKHIIVLPEVDQIHKKLWILFQVSSDPFGPVILTNCKFHGNSIHRAVSAV